MNEIIYHPSNFTRRPSERGAALITSIFALLLVTVLGIALTSLGVTALTVSSNDRENTEAFYIAEAGIVHAVRIVSRTGSSNFTNILKAGDGAPGTGDELSTTPVPSSEIRISQGGVAFAAGTYTVRVTDDAADTDGEANTDSNGRLVIVATGIGRNGATATVEAVIGLTSSPAVLVNGNLNISGNPILRGEGGSLHTNATLDFDGDACADGYFSASSSIIDPSKAKSGGSCSNPGQTRPAQSPITVPTFDIRNDFRHRATYILGINGKVYNSSGTLIDDATGDGKWVMSDGGEWSWDSGGKRWILGGDKLLDGTFYSEGNMSISGNPGTAASPKTVTLIAEGYIEISGNPTLRPHLESYSVMAGTDLKMNGNAGSGTPNFQGLHYAGHQLDFSGNPGINGQVIARNLADTKSPGDVNLIELSSGFMKISGNPTITYDGGLTGGKAEIIGWREIRF